MTTLAAPPITDLVLDVHVLQSFPYSRLNRDDLGSPKDCVYGDALRGRISSQCQKRAARQDVSEADPVRRTARIIGAVLDRLVARGWDAGAARVAGEQVVLAAGLGIDSKNADKTTVLMLVTDSQITDFADLCDAYRPALEAHTAACAAGATDGGATPEQDEKGKAARKLKPVKGAGRILPVDDVARIVNSVRGTVALFGRFTAEVPGANVEGAVQVAHAITTHAVNSEVDFFTAVDDLLPAQGYGSAHVGTTEHLSGTFYRYATVGLGELVKNLAGDQIGAAHLALGFSSAFASSVPSGSKRSTAPHTPPALVHVALRRRPLNLVAAFEQPVRAAGGGHLTPSMTALSQHAAALDTLLGAPAWWAGWAGLHDGDLPGLGRRQESYPALWKAVAAALGVPAGPTA